MRLVTLLLCCPLLAITLAGAGESPAPAWAPEPPLIEGVDLVLNMDFPAAYQHFEEVLRRWPDRPDGYLGKGLALLTEHRGRRRLRANRDAIVQQLQQAAERAEQRFDARREIRDLFLHGMARGFESQVELAAGNLWSAFLAIREARSLLRKALSQDPGFVDPYLGLGFYDYLLSELPGLQRFVVSLLLDKGDKRRGLEEIRLAASRGRYVREYARAALMSVYAYGERQFDLALPLALALKERYPGNPDFYYAVATIYSELDRWDEALAVAQEIRERMERPTNGFRQEPPARYHHLLGKIYLDRRDPAQALTHLGRSLNSDMGDFPWIRGWALTRTGMAYDLRGQREEALRAYREATRVREGAGRRYAERFIRQPYRGTKEELKPDR